MPLNNTPYLKVIKCSPRGSSNRNQWDTLHATRKGKSDGVEMISLVAIPVPVGAKVTLEGEVNYSSYDRSSGAMEED